MTTFKEITRRVRVLTKSHGAYVAETNAIEGDLDETHVARAAELFEEADSIRSALTSLGFGVIFNELAETVKHVA